MDILRPLLRVIMSRAKFASNHASVCAKTGATGCAKSCATACGKACATGCGKACAVTLTLMVTLGAWSATPAPRGLVVLIPGFASSVLHEIPPHDLPGESVSPYFSANVAETFISQGYLVLAVTDLKGAGELVENGERVLQQLRDYLTRFPEEKPPIYLVGHSMGGLLALYVANQVGRELPIRKIVTLSTPLEGSHVANCVVDGILPVALVERALESLLPIVDLRAIVQLTTARVHAFLAELRLPQGLSVHAFSGRQPQNRVFLPSWDAPIQSPLYNPFSHLLDEDSDGVVGLSSSRPLNLSLPTDGKSPLVVINEPVIAELDHEEQHMDYRVIAKLFQTDNVDIIPVRQREFYSNMIKVLEQ
ncbi:MAG: alpha/beta fold hydrolase [Bdellovibrionales bacterium]|nr:alpha/beta fold hydrolase [Bdellovibrionales bacterium]